MVAAGLTGDLADRRPRYLKMAFDTSRLSSPRTLESFDFTFQPSLHKPRNDTLAGLNFIDRRESVLFLGSPGIGKSQIACALGVCALKAGNSV